MLLLGTLNLTHFTCNSLFTLHTSHFKCNTFSYFNSLRNVFSIVSVLQLFLLLCQQSINFICRWQQHKKWHQNVDQLVKVKTLRRKCRRTLLMSSWLTYAMGGKLGHGSTCTRNAYLPYTSYTMLIVSSVYSLVSIASIYWSIQLI